MNQRTTYDVKNWTVFGCVYFKPPFQITDSLINEARIVHVIKGKSKLYSANQLIELKSGDTLIMKSDNFVNNWQKNESDDEINKVIVFQLNSDFLKYLYNNKLPNWYDRRNETVGNSIEKALPNQLINSFYQNLELYIDEPDLMNEEFTQIKTRELISLLIKTDVTGSIKKTFGQLFETKEYDFQEIIQNNLFEDLNVENLAFLANMSLSSFKRKFSSIYGTSPNKYIISKRLEKAQRLINTTDLSISQIAYDCGFSDVGYFSKTFKKNYNILPSELKR